MSNGIIHVTDVGEASLDRANRLLAGIPNGTWKAAHSALTRAAGKAKTEAGRFAAEEYAITKGTFMANVRIKSKLKGDSGGVASVSVLYAGQVLPLLTFRTRYSRGGGITTTVKRGGGGVLAHAFIADIGGLSVYERVGKERFPLEKKYGPSTAHMMQDETVTENMSRLVEQTFNQRIEHEITRLLNGWGG